MLAFFHIIPIESQGNLPHAWRFTLFINNFCKRESLTPSQIDLKSSPIPLTGKEINSSKTAGFHLPPIAKDPIELMKSDIEDDSLSTGD